VGSKERLSIIKRIESLRESRVLTYVTSDRQGASAQIGEDAIRPMYDHLRKMTHCKRLDLYIYSRGGAIDMPWRIVTALRATADEWNILVPFRANSAATLIALGADHIFLGRQGELGPIDPILGIQRNVPAPGGGMAQVQENISVEDVMAYIKFIGERAGLSDQDALALGLTKLAERIDALTLGNAYRTHLHIRDVARRILLSRTPPANEQALKTIIETLAERVYAHGHAIGFEEARSIGLPVEAAPTELDAAMWDLLNDYDAELKLRAPIDPFAVTIAQDVHTERATLAAIESDWASSTFEADIRVQARRQMPPNLSVTLNLSIQVPANPAGPAPNPQALQQMLQQLQGAVLPEAQRAVQEALGKQAPVAGIELRTIGGDWHVQAF
jgi:hypothetical protein